MDNWYLLRSGLCAPAFNMAMDEALLEHATRFQRPVLRFYGWTEPAATFGFSQRYAEISAWTTLRPLIRRPTGGGLVPHDCDWTYSLVFPTEHPWHRLKAVESYRAVHEWVQRAFARVGVQGQLATAPERAAPGQCFAGAERFDLLLGGIKVAGAAQRRNRSGLLIQGSVQPRDSRVARADWEQAMLAVHAVHWSSVESDHQLNDRARELVNEKYSQAWHNQRR